MNPSCPYKKTERQVGILLRTRIHHVCIPNHVQYTFGLFWAKTLKRVRTGPDFKIKAHFKLVRTGQRRAYKTRPKTQGLCGPSDSPLSHPSYSWALHGSSSSSPFSTLFVPKSNPWGIKTLAPDPVHHLALCSHLFVVV